VAWLRTRPLMHVADGYAMVHAGLLPEWSVALASALAREVEVALQGRDYRQFLARLYGDKPTRWDDELEGTDRLRVIVNAMTRLRVLSSTGEMMLAYKGEPGESSNAFTPWFDMPGRRSADHAIVCGHWSALGVRVRPDLLSLDSGCVWGRSLTAVCLEDRRLFEVGCPRSPGQVE
jgi:bis(5'-nucleosyl)-tetraphosphatase (symmetrical)